MPGPVPKSDSQLQRPRSRKGNGHTNATIGLRYPIFNKPEADPNWHPIAIGLFESVETSGQSVYYQDSDWWVLYHVCEEISEYKKSEYVDRNGELVRAKRNGQILSAITSAMTSLLLTEGDRRRVRLELAAPTEKKDGLTTTARRKYASVQG